MKVEQVHLRQVRLRLSSPFTTSFGTIIERPCIIVEVEAEGLKGLAECVAFEAPWYSYETVTTAWHIMLDYLIPCLMGQDVHEPEAVWGLFARVRGHNMAKAAIEMACWDLIARSRRISLSEATRWNRERVRVGVSVGIQPSPQELVDTVGTLSGRWIRSHQAQDRAGRGYRVRRRGPRGISERHRCRSTLTPPTHWPT